MLLALGLGTRWAALALSATMATAFVLAHGMALSGERSGELPFVYAAGFVAVLVMGPGRYRVDARLRWARSRAVTRRGSSIPP